MTVTALTYLTCISDAVSEGARNALSQICHTVKNDPECHGAIVFEQIEDTRVALLASVWDSPEQHQAWGHANGAEAGRILSGFFALDKNVSLHLAGVNICGSTGGVPAIQSPVLSIGHVGVSAEEREEFQAAWDGVKGILEEFAAPHIVLNGWRVEKGESEDFVFLCGWPAVEKHMEFAKTEGFSKYAAPILAFAKSRDVKHYQPSKDN